MRPERWRSGGGNGGRTERGAFICAVEAHGAARAEDRVPARGVRAGPRDRRQSKQSRPAPPPDADGRRRERLSRGSATAASASLAPPTPRTSGRAFRSASAPLLPLHAADRVPRPFHRRNAELQDGPRRDARHVRRDGPVVIRAGVDLTLLE